LEPTDDFTEKVLRSVAAETSSSTTVLTENRKVLVEGSLIGRLSKTFKWVGLFVGGLVGFSHCLYFIFGIWFASVAA